jgi:Sugar (pentulose and hexulose) kinases
MGYLLSFDLGTGGIKAGLFRTDGTQVSFEFMHYATYYPQPDWHEQKPQEWWQAVCDATQRLLHYSRVSAAEIGAIAASGHSLVAAPLDSDGSLLLESVPIWSDRRAREEARAFFAKIDYETWYKLTGNGDPPETYSLFKLMWLKTHQPEVFARTAVTLGSKDYINYRLTGCLATDYSYASGSGAFDLRRWTYDEAFIEAAGLPRRLFIEPGESFAAVGTVSTEAAQQTGLRAGMPVFCGGVDNACMALGTTGIGNGRVYTSLGSSAWIAISAREPILDMQTRPFVFAHVEKGYYTTGVSIFSAANGYRWAKEVFAADLPDYSEMDRLAATAPLGANGVMFNPSLAGGSSQEPSDDLEGAFFGLKLSSTQADLLRAILEGVALSLRCFCLAVVEPLMQTGDAMILCGGGAKSDLWMQIFADVYGRKVVVTNVDQEAASLGAAAIAARGAGYWPDYTPLDGLFTVQKTFTPDPQRCRDYTKIAGWFEKWVRALSTLHSDMRQQQIHERMEK